MSRIARTGAPDLDVAAAGTGKAAAVHPSTVIILTGTDPDTIKGGIGTAVAGYRHALIQCGLFGGLIPTFEAGSGRGKWLPWLRALPALRRSIRALRRRGSTVVVYGHAGPRWSLPRESLALLWARAHGARTLLQLHTPHMDRYMDKPWVRFLLRLAFLPVHRVTVLSPWWQRRLTEGGFPGTAVVPNPLSAALEATARKTLERLDQADVAPDHAGDRVVILAMARLTRGKGIHTAIQALAHLPANFVLRIAGDGPQLQNLKALAVELDVADRAHFLGWVSGAEKDLQLSEADLFCAPSKADAFSMSMIEALCQGLPVVSVRSRAIGDLVQNGETGFLVEPDDAAGVAEAISALTPPTVRAGMGRAAAGRMLSELGGAIVGRRIEQVANALSGGGR